MKKPPLRFNEYYYSMGLKPKKKKPTYAELKWVGPVSQKQESGFEFDVWGESTNTYRVARLDGRSPSKEPRFNTLINKGDPKALGTWEKWDFLHWDVSKNGRPMDFSSLKDAFYAVSKYHKTSKGLEAVGSNSDEVVTKAAKKGKHNIDAADLVDTSSKPTKSTPTKRSKAGTPVVEEMLSLLRTGTKSKPVSRDKLITKLCLMFPDLPQAKIRKSVSDNISWFFPKKGIKVQGDKDTGYWL